MTIYKIKDEGLFMNKKILIIDDSAGILLGYRKFLSHFNVHVDISSTKQEALKLLDDNSYRIIITDLKLDKSRENKDGLEIASYTKNNFPETGIILITSYGNSELKEKAKENGVDVYLEKPITGNEMIKAINDLGCSLKKRRK